MSRIRCPRCNEYVPFNKKDVVANQKFILTCPCGKEFAVRIRPLAKSDQEPIYGKIVILENEFCHKQELPLQLGDNIVGRMCKGTEIELPIDTGDMSMDRRHSVITVTQDEDQQLHYFLRDNRSLTGTFYRNVLLAKNERIEIEIDDVFTIGATSIIIKSEK
jgi:hypothetical protein